MKMDHSPTKVDIVSAWIADEGAAAPDCSVLAAVKSATQQMRLDENRLLASLRLLCESPMETEDHVAD